MIRGLELIRNIDKNESVMMATTVDAPAVAAAFRGGSDAFGTVFVVGAEVERIHGRLRRVPCERI